MNAGEIVVAAVGAVGGVGGAVFAWVQARAAVGSRDDAKTAQRDAELAQQRAEDARDEALELARKATAAAERQAAAQEEANRLELEARMPDVWTGPRRVNGSVNVWTNTSGRDIVVMGSSVFPPNVGKLAGLEQDEYPFPVLASGALRTVKLNYPGVKGDFVSVYWCFVGDEEEHETRFPFD